MDEMLHGLMGYQKKRTRIQYILIFNSIGIWGRRTRNLRLYGHYLEHCPEDNLGLLSICIHLGR